MGLFSRWRVAHKQYEDERWKVYKEKYALKPSLTDLEEKYGGGFFKIQKLSGLGDILSTVELESDAALKGSRRTKSGRRVEIPIGSGADRTTMVIPESLLDEPNKLQSISALMQSTRMPSQDVVDFGAKFNIVSGGLGGKLDEILLGVLSIVAGGRKGLADQNKSVVDPSESMVDVKVAKGGLTIGSSKKPLKVKESIEPKKHTLLEEGE